MITILKRTILAAPAFSAVRALRFYSPSKRIIIARRMSKRVLKLHQKLEKNRQPAAIFARRRGRFVNHHFKKETLPNDNKTSLPCHACGADSRRAGTTGRRRLGSRPGTCRLHRPAGHRRRRLSHRRLRRIHLGRRPDQHGRHQQGHRRRLVQRRRPRAGARRRVAHGAHHAQVGGQSCGRKGRRA